jgi:hypothetical protein
VVEESLCRRGPFLARSHSQRELQTILIPHRMRSG